MLDKAAMSGNATSNSPEATIHVRPRTNMALMPDERSTSNRLAVVLNVGDFIEKKTIKINNIQSRMYSGENSFLIQDNMRFIISSP
jgi:hypothetical protein